MSGSNRAWTRREWLQAAAAGTITAAAGAGPSAAGGPRPWGVQIYTVREQLKTQAAETFKAIADIGYKEVEVLHPGMADSVRLARAVGLSPVSLHIESPLVTRDWSAYRDMAKLMGTELPPDSYDITTMAADAKALGIKYLVVSYLMPAERSKPGFFDTFPDAMNKAGEAVKKAGLQLCYHNHGFEFEKGGDGRTVLEKMMSRLDPSLVKLELDVFWVSIAGTDPVSLLQKYSGRIALMHLKDKATGSAVETNEGKVPPTAFKEVGSGSLDFRAILKAADAAGVEHFFVEQDHTPGDPVESLKKSFAFLQQLA